jgi:hypothetical protein
MMPLCPLAVHILIMMLKIQCTPLRRLLRQHNIDFSPEYGVAKLRRVLKKYITREMLTAR